MQRIIGIDHSLSSPAVSILSEDASFWHSKNYFLTSTKKFVGKFDNVLGTEHKPYTSEMQRYLNIASWAVYDCGLQKEDLVFLEDYSMASKGKTFTIAENTAILKYLLFHNDIKYITVPPTVVKKFAGKGNASKEMMYEFFLTKTGVDLKKHLNVSGKLASPITDVVDAFYLGCYGYDNIHGIRSPIDGD